MLSPLLHINIYANYYAPCAADTACRYTLASRLIWPSINLAISAKWHHQVCLRLAASVCFEYYIAVLPRWQSGQPLTWVSASWMLAGSLGRCFCSPCAWQLCKGKSDCPFFRLNVSRHVTCTLLTWAEWKMMREKFHNPVFIGKPWGRSTSKGWSKKNLACAMFATKKRKLQ